MIDFFFFLNHTFWSTLNLSLGVRSDPLYGYVIFDCHATTDYKCNQKKKMLNELFDSNFSTHLKLQYLIPYILCATKLNRASRIINRFWLFVLIEIAAFREMD